MHIGDTIANNRQALIEARHILRMGVCVEEAFYNLGIRAPLQLVDEALPIAKLTLQILQLLLQPRNCAGYHAAFLRLQSPPPGSDSLALPLRLGRLLFLVVPSRAGLPRTISIRPDACCGELLSLKNIVAVATFGLDAGSTRRIGSTGATGGPARCLRVDVQGRTVLRYGVHIALE